MTARVNHENALNGLLRYADIVRQVVRISAFQSRQLRIRAQRSDALYRPVRSVLGGRKHVGPNTLSLPIFPARKVDQGQIAKYLHRIGGRSDRSRGP